MSPAGVCEDDEDQARFCISQGQPTSFSNYSSNWFPRAENTTPEYPRGAQQFQPDASFIHEQNLVLSLAGAELHVVRPNVWRGEVSRSEGD